MSSLSGLVGVVTGADSGIGFEITSRLLRDGATVFAVDCRIENLKEKYLMDPKASDNIEIVMADVSSSDQMESLNNAVFARFGKIDFLVANAGVAAEGTAGEVAIETWNRALDINLSGVWKTVRAMLPSMQLKNSGSVVLIASVAGLVGLPNIAAYAASKGGVISLGRQMARDYAKHNIRINVICPGPIDTPLLRKAYESRQVAVSDAQKMIPLGRLGTTQDVSALAAFLVGSETTWMTGCTIPVDGGVASLVGGVS
jgi:NAD(P)-dependent dehydrogenase (short-subunit alcohol dehydrogenase family)